MIVLKLGTDMPPIVTAAGVYVRDLGWGARELRATDFLAARVTSHQNIPLLFLSQSAETFFLAI
jgi:hypothetical protein